MVQSQAIVGGVPFVAMTDTCSAGFKMGFKMAMAHAGLLRCSVFSALG